MEVGRTPYQGTEPCVFISYSHRARDRVLLALDALSARGYRMWYDADIQAGER